MIRTGFRSAFLAVYAAAHLLLGVSAATHPRGEPSPHGPHLAAEVDPGCGPVHDGLACILCRAASTEGIGSAAVGDGLPIQAPTGAAPPAVADGPAPGESHALTRARAPPALT